MHSLTSRSFLNGMAALAPVALCFGAAPQSTFPNSLYQKQNLIQHAPNAPTKTVLLDLDGDFRKDAVVLSGGSLQVSWAVGSFMSAQTISNVGLVRDLAVLPGLNIGDPDRLITVGVDAALSWSYTENVLNPEDPGTFNSTDMGLPTWAFAGRILACDVDAGGTDNDLLAVALDNVTIGIVGNVGVVSADPNLAQDIWPTFLSTDDQGVSQPVLDVAVGNVLDGTTNRDELVVLRANDLWVFELADGPTSIPINTISQGNVVVLKNEVTAPGFEELALAAKDASTGETWIRTAHEGTSGMEFSPFIITNYSDVVGLCAGDIVGLTMEPDDVDEIVMFLPDSRALVVFSPSLISGHIEYRGEEEIMLMGANTFDGLSQASPLIEDVDGDGTKDLVHAMTAGSRTSMVVFHGLPYEIQAMGQGDYIPVGRITLMTSANGDPVYQPRLEQSEVLGTYNVQLTVAMPNINTSFPDLEVVTWVLREGKDGINRRALFRSVFYDGGPGTQPGWGLNAQVFHFSIDQKWGAGSGSYPTLDGTTGGSPIAYTTDLGSDGQPIPLPIYGTVPNPVHGDTHHANYSLSPDIFFFEFRAVELDAQEQVLAAGVSIFVAHFSLKNDWEGSTGYLETHWPEYPDVYAADSLSAMDQLAQDDRDMVKHFGDNGIYTSTYEVREIDPIDIPLAWPIPPVGGPPTTTGVGPHKGEGPWPSGN